MYENQFSGRRTASRSALVVVAASALAFAHLATGAAPAVAQVLTDPNSVIRKISGLSDKLELTTNTSRILTLEKNIPRVQVNNPELIAVTPLSANQVQISAKKAGVTQINLWDEDGSIHSVDVQIYGDARELQMALQTQFPHASIKVFRYSESLVLTGFVDRPDHISPIMQLAQDYAPKVINNINVGGVQQVLLKVKVMEVSRTKLRQLGVDWAWFGGGGFAINRAGGLISQFSSSAQTVEQLGDSFSFGIIGDSSSFFGVLDALQECRVAKILAEPNIMAVSGRPAQFQDGGEFPIVVPQSLGTSSVEFKPFGTQVDFLPIVLGNGNIRLEVRPRISDRDFSHAVTLPGNSGNPIPALTVRQVDTAVEMKAGQTFALAGLVQERTDDVKHGLPYLSDVPVFGVPFRRTRSEVNEIELLIVVTPEFVDAINPEEMPCEGGPGTFTTSPNNHGLYCGGQMEVPSYCNPTQGLNSCGNVDCNGNGGCSTCGNGGTMMNGTPAPVMNGSVVLPGGTGYDDSPTPATNQPQPSNSPSNATPSDSTGPATLPTPPQKSGAQSMPDDITLPVTQYPGAAPQPNSPTARPVTPPQQPLPTSTTSSQPPVPVGPVYTAPRPYSPQRQPVFMRNASRPYNPQSQNVQPAVPQGGTGLIGPVGYDAQ